MTRLAILRPVSGLSARQERILWAMNDYRNIVGYWPSIGDLRAQTRTSSKSVIAYNLQRLHERGLVLLADNKYDARGRRIAPTVAFARVNGERRIYEAVP